MGCELVIDTIASKDSTGLSAIRHRDMVISDSTYRVYDCMSKGMRRGQPCIKAKGSCSPLRLGLEWDGNVGNNRELV